jgi:hypothetical protein
MNSVDLYKQLSPKVIEALQKEGVDYKIGDMFIDGDSHHSGRVIRIVDIFEDNEYYKGDVRIKYQEAKDWEATKWNEGSTCSISQFGYYFGRAEKIEGKTFAEYRKEALDVIEGKIEIDFYKDQNTDSLNTDNALMSRNSKESLNALTNHLDGKKKQAELIRAFVGYEMEKRKQELEKIKEKLYGVVAEFKKKIKKIMRVITTIELYLGIDEELFQIQDGQKASEDEPIQFRQMVLYMDEEIGHWKDGGLDFTNIEWFDHWLVTNDNYKKLIPENKGVVVFRPRRYDKDYKGYDPAVAAEMNRIKVTYLLIRNGECLYRVYTEKITIRPRLFPQRKELQELLDKLESEMNKEDFWDKKESQEDAENLIYQYKKRAILMQGLIDRTDVFHPLKKPVSIFKLHESEGLVNFIYDDEVTLPSGRLPFKEWKKQINEKIQHGSRIVCAGTYGNGKENKYRIYYYVNDFNAPKTPNQGIYSVEEYRVDEIKSFRESDWLIVKSELDAKDIKWEIVEELPKTYCKRYKPDGSEYEINDPTVYEMGYRVRAKFPHLTIKHNPGGDTRHGWDDWGGHERKNRIRFRIYKSDEILNYDQISLDDIDFYLTSRVDRPNYLEMMPLLETMKEWRLKEIENEKHFAEFVIGRNIGKLPGLTDEQVQQRVLECIEWWKFKNQWKRPIDKDDTLALRMIERRIKSKNYQNLKWEDD